MRMSKRNRLQRKRLRRIPSVHRSLRIQKEFWRGKSKRKCKMKREGWSALEQLTNKSKKRKKRCNKSSNRKESVELARTYCSKGIRRTS